MLRRVRRRVQNRISFCGLKGKGIVAIESHGKREGTGGGTRPCVPQLRSLLTQFIESEMRSCSMDYGCITPEYVQRAWGGRVAIEDITQGLTELRKQGFMR